MLGGRGCQDWVLSSYWETGGAPTLGVVTSSISCPGPSACQAPDGLSSRRLVQTERCVLGVFDKG